MSLKNISWEELAEKSNGRITTLKNIGGEIYE